MRYTIVITLLAVLFAASCIGKDNPDTPSGEPCLSTPQGAVSFPIDEYPHDEPIEWYYWTGHIQTEEGRWFGYELVFFLVDLREQENLISNPAISGIAERFGSKMLVLNHAITDIEAGSFHYTGGFAPKMALGPGEPLRYEVGRSFALLDNGNDILHGEVDDYAIDLNLDSVKAPVLQHGDGYHEYDFGGYTYYYSRERIDTTGTLTIDGKAHVVEGTSWFDHQWGQLEAAIDVGWDWFAIQLDDNREIMVFTINVDSQTALLGGSLTSSDCRTTEISIEDLEITPLGTWTSPHTDKTYPMGWRIRVDDMDLTLTPVVEDQELVSPYKIYWEGACEVIGDMPGRAYVELTGY